MLFLEEIKKLGDKKIRLFVDMDGVIADYNVGVPKDYDKKRPLTSSIKQLEEISKLPNVELFILSVTRETIGRKEKNDWLDIYAPFFKKENRVIISREEHNYTNSRILKSRYIKKLKRDDSLIILIDDDPSILRKIMDNNDDIILYKDTVLVD